VNFDGADRRRVALVSVLTLLALPSLWLMSRDEPTAPATVAPGGVAVGETADATTDASSDDPAAASDPTSVEALDGTRSSAPEPALGTAGGAFLDAPEIVPDERPADDEPIAVAVPAPPPGSVAHGRASYRSTFARDNATNVDNGRRITCVASVNPAGSTDEVVLHTSQFTQIADLADAPVPVELSW